MSDAWFTHRQYGQLNAIRLDGASSVESQITAKGLEMRSEKAARYPRVDLVAQYALFAKFNHYEDYYRSFQRNNSNLQPEEKHDGRDGTRGDAPLTWTHLQ